MSRVAATLSVLVLIGCSSGEGPKGSIDLDTLRDKVAGGWAGQMIGVSYGAPTEFRFNDRIIEKEIEWSPEMVRNSLRQDDLYVDMTFCKVLDSIGLEATSEQFGEEFRNAKYRLWHANLAARRALRRGVKAPLSGTPRYNAHANDIDFQIEADFAGLMAPGMPQSSNDICDRAGRVMNYGDGLYGGMFVSGMYAAAYFEDDVRKIVEAGLACLPPESGYARLISDTLRWSDESPQDWQEVWRRIEEKWTKREACPAGALRAFNIDAKVNGAYIVIGLLYGGGDFSKTVEITTRCGKDSDCNPSSAAGVLGVKIGYEAIPDEWKGAIESIADEKFDFTDYSFRTIVDSTLDRAVRLAQANGGRLEGGVLYVKLQEPVPAKLEQWDDWGEPVERIGADDPRWSFRGPWKEVEMRGREQGSTRSADQKGAEAEVSFEGTGAILTGPFLSSGGQLDVYLDGKAIGTFDVYNDEPRGRKNYEAIWHDFNLAPGKHTLRLAVRGEPIFDSQGSEVVIEGLIVFRKG